MSPITREVLRDYLNDALPDAELAAVERAGAIGGYHEGRG